MTHKPNTTVRSTLMAGAFISTMTLTGCGLFSSQFQRSGPFGASGDADVQVAHDPSQADDRAQTQYSRADAAPRQAQWASAEPSIVADTPEHQARFASPLVNVFGEFDGARRARISAIHGEANFQQHTFIAEGSDNAVSIDPTGRYMVFTSTRQYSYPKIYLQRVNGSSVVELTSDASEDAFPTFSPDGKHIAFSSTRSGNWDLYTMDLDGRNIVQVTSGPMQDLHPSYSPDGTRLVYCSMGGRSGEWELWTVDLNTGERRQVGFGLFPVWSPDTLADRIAFQRPRQRGSRWFSLWTLDLVNGDGVRQTEVAVSSNAAIITPAWSRDGSRLAFATIVEPSARAGGAMQQDIWVVRADGTHRQRITDGIGENLLPAWGANNRVYFVSNRGGTQTIWSAVADQIPDTTAAAARQSQSQVGSVDTGAIVP